MQLKFTQTLLEAQECESKILGLAWSPNNLKLAVATSDRQVLLFDENGEKRDKFSTKPADSDAGKKSYIIQGIAFSPDSTKLAVAQSDCIVYIYKLGEKWGEKKAICNKFLQTDAVTCVIWLSSGPIICGLASGKVRALHIKNNKSQSLYSSNSFVVSLASNSRGNGFLSGHVDGNIIRFFVSHDNENQEVQGCIVTHSCPPCALAWPQGQVFAAGSDKCIAVYNTEGRTIKQFDYTKDTTEYEFTIACCSSSGQAVVIGSFNRLRVFIWNSKKSVWEETTSKQIRNLYSVTALAWKRDGSMVACGSLCGVVYCFESVLKRTVWRDKFEIIYVGPSQILIKSLHSNEPGVVLKTQFGREIEDIKIMGKDRYVLARTEDTLLVGDLELNLFSEVAWNTSGKHERFYFDNPSVCLIFNAGELSLIEYGENAVLSAVRTEFVNPHLISVRLNERHQKMDNKKLAYLLDLKTICIMDLISGIVLVQINHESKIDWLELSETGHKLLFRDKKQKLILVDTATSTKKCVYSSVSFAQWVAGSDVAVAQSGTNLAIWYNIDLPDHPTLVTVKGDVVDVIRNNGKTEAVAVEGNSTNYVQLDEGLLEFGTAVHDNDYGRAILFLEKIGNTSEAEAMWHNLATIALKQHNLILAERCNAALGNVTSVHYLRECIKIDEEYAQRHDDYTGHCPEVWARLAILNGDLNTAENIHLEQGHLEDALTMYKKLHKWDEALRLAEQRGYDKYDDLKEEYMKLLKRKGQYEKVGQILEQQGNYQQAMTMFMNSNCFAKASTLLQQHVDLLNDGTLTTNVLKNLLKHELFERAAEIYEKLKKPDMAMECYRKGKSWSKAVELARVISPERVITLEEEWGDSLAENRQMDAAINHYIEAGNTRKALNAAVAAHQWKKAVHIVQVIDDPEAVLKYCKIIGKHFADIKDYATAEKIYLRAEMYMEVVDMYNEAGLWDKAHNLASRFLEQNQVSDMFIKHAEQLENAGKYRDAEKLYLSVDAPDLAIAMYKRVEQYDHMIRLVENYHPDLLQRTHFHLGQQLDSQGKYRAAEIHYLAAGDWKAAMNMYRTQSLWEEAYRVAKQNAEPTAANQVAFLWAHSLPIDSAIKLLNKYGLLEACIDYACETYQFDFAFQLCKNLNSKVNDVHYKFAMMLEDEGKFAEAEEAFILAEKPKEAVLMYVHSQNWSNALRVAEVCGSNIMTEVLQAQAMQCFLEKQFPEFETLLLRAQLPEVIVHKYKSADMWVDALRVCKDYLPSHLPALQAEYTSSNYNTNSDVDIETLLSRANEWTLAGQHMQAIECLLQVNSNIADSSIIKRVLMRTADMVNKFIFGQDALDVIKILAPRLIEIGEHAIAAQLYVSVDLMKEAIDSFILMEDWNRARKLAKELEPAYESYIESKYKARLLKEGNVEQLADIDIIGALDLLAEQGQWIRCIEKAKSHSSPVLHKYTALYASQLLKDGFALEALNLYNTYGAPAIVQNFNIYTRIASYIFAMSGLSDSEHFNTWAQLRQLLFNLNESLKIAVDVDVQNKDHFKKLLLIAHYYTVRTACRSVQSLKSVGTKISVALLRHTDIIPADKAFYEAGIDLKEEGKISEAFVFLNHYLDICEAIEEGENQLIDHSDLIQTDFPSNIPLPDYLYLHDDLETHDNVREWVLAISMDQRVNQTLPIDDRKLFESSLISGESACIVTGYPIRKQPVLFQNSYQADKETWAKLNTASKISPESYVPNIISFILEWCGPISN